MYIGICEVKVLLIADPLEIIRFGTLVLRSLRLVRLFPLVHIALQLKVPCGVGQQRRINFL